MGMGKPGRAAESPPGAPRLLIVEEDAEMRRTLRTFLHGEGFRVVEAGDAAEAVRRAQDGGYAGVVLNAGPAGEAWELLPELRRLVASAPIVLTTAVPDRPTAQRASAMGAAGLLVKPFVLDDLLPLLPAVPGATRMTTHDEADGRTAAPQTVTRGGGA
jgi:DNA-binding response OmpR family regulator